MPTRTILFHITAFQQSVFYCLAILSVLICFHGFYRRYRLWRQGKPSARVSDWPARFKLLWDQVMAHRRVRRRKYAGRMHVLLFYGLFMLFIGTVIVAIEHYGAMVFGHHWFYKGAFYVVVKLLLDLFGLGLLIATIMALYRRYSAKPPSLGHQGIDGAFLLLLLAATVTGFVLEGAGIAADPARTGKAPFSPVGTLTSLALSGLTPTGYLIAWWVHIPLVLSVIAALPYGRWLHLFVIPNTILFQPERRMGELEPISMEEVEKTGKIGFGRLADMDRWTLMSLDGCMECGRCTDVCPANKVGKELNPKQIVLDLRALLGTQNGRRGEGEKGRPGDQLSTLNSQLSTDVISDESLWACTNCHACVRECPALIRHVDIIDGIRRYRVAEGRLSGNGATMLRQLGSRENPWGLPGTQRLDWARDLEIKEASADDGREVLLWVGCAGAFDPRAQKTVRALAQLLQKAGVRFTVLGPKERCTGDPARRTGDEFLFQQLAEANIATLGEIKTTRIVTQCPHCLHTLKNEYPQFNGRYEVLHHTQYLRQLMDEGRLKLPKGIAETVTYHDPCFLARVNGESEAPRSLFGKVLQTPLTEPENIKEKTLCCGAGGGRMWMEEPPDQRPGVNRANELLATGAKTVAVGCPFCKIMIGDSVAQAGGENAPPVMDVAEVLLRALADGGRNSDVTEA